MDQMRAQRTPKLGLADIEINKHLDTDPNAVSAEATWRTYRNSLRAITDSYKNHATDSGHATALDNLAADISDLTWPTEPT